MRIHEIRRLQRAVRWLRSRFAPGVFILHYHRVVKLPLDPHLLCVTPQHFVEHLEILRKYARPMRLQHLVQALHDGDLPHRAVVVTFDDGYADNLYNAKPLLDRYDIPATVFVTAGCIGQEREFWWDELERLLLQPGTLPETLRLNVNGSLYRWELGKVANYSENDYQSHRYWDVEQKDNPSLRQQLFRSLYQLLHPLHHGERQRVLDELLVWAGAKSMSRPTHRVLSHDEVVRLAEGGLVEVGAHTVTHPSLPTLPVALQRDEIQRSKARLEEILDCSVNSFAYPYGSLTAETVSVVRDAGFICACSSLNNVVRRGTDHFRLPRVLVRYSNGDDFARQLGEWCRG